jgi:hypothetical protein
MRVRSILASSLVAVVLLATGCSDTPTEPSSAPTTGNLVISLTQPCALPGSVSVDANGRPLGALVIPGQNTFSLPAGSYSLSFVRGQNVFGGTGQVQVPAGGTVVVTDPPGACMSTIGAP